MLEPTFTSKKNPNQKRDLFATALSLDEWLVLGHKIQGRISLLKWSELQHKFEFSVSNYQINVTTQQDKAFQLVNDVT